MNHSILELSSEFLIVGKEQDSLAMHFTLAKLTFESSKIEYLRSHSIRFQ